MNLTKKLFENYEKYKDYDLQSDLIFHSEIKRKIEILKQNKSLKIQPLGKSIEGREIYSIIFGKGKRKILAWSQMHGDEPTATAAIFDIINYFIDDEESEPKKNILKELEIHFIPMLNPDGAEKYKRENAFNMDLNRDAHKIQSDESNILLNYSKKINPEFGFNLHDQNSYYAVGISSNNAALSFLAPPYDISKSINYTREKSMQVISLLKSYLDEIIEGKIARYNDEYEPRAFGDNLMKNGISTILIESGFAINDFKKDFVRKLNFIAIILSLKIIAQFDYEKIYYGKYFEIPENKELFFDLLIKNITLNYNSRKFKIDIGINRTKKLDRLKKSFYYESKIIEIGDLSIYHGIEEFDFSDYEIDFVEKIKKDEKPNFIIHKNKIPKYEIRNGFLLEV